MKRIDFIISGMKWVAIPASMGCSGYAPCWHTFTTLINGKHKHYLLDWHEVTKEEGNTKWLDYKRQLKDVKIEKKESESKMTYDDIIKQLNSSYDQYVEYIEDGKQYEAACAHNREIDEKIHMIMSWKEVEHAD